MSDPLRAAVLATLGRRPSVAARRRLAAQLRALADEQERLADAQQRERAKPPAARMKSRAGGRPSAAWIRVERAARRSLPELRILLSRALYYAAGRPERLDVQRIGVQLRLIPARGDAGYAVVVNAGGVRINASGARDLIAQDDGRYAAELSAGAIVVGAAMD